MACEIGKAVALELILYPEKDRESSQGRKSGSTIAQKGQLEEFDGLVGVWKEVKLLICKPWGCKRWSCCSFSWLKGGRGINLDCGSRGSVNPGAEKRKSR